MYNDTVLSFFNNPTNMGSLESPDAIGHAGIEGQGPFMVIELSGTPGCIAAARFRTYGCPAAVASGQWTTSWIVGKSTEKACTLEADDLMLILGGLPLGKEHCAILAVNALRDGVKKLGKALPRPVDVRLD